MGNKFFLKEIFFGRKFWGACFGGADFFGEEILPAKFLENFLRVKSHSGGRKEYWDAKMFLRKDIGSKNFWEQIFIFNGFSTELI